MLLIIIVYVRRSTDSLVGLNPTHEHFVAVTFNVILPVKYWLWDETFSLSLRFGHSKLGNWKKDVGEFTVHK